MSYGSSKAVVLKDEATSDGINYRLAIGGDASIGSTSSLVNATVTGTAGEYTFTGAHSSAYLVPSLTGAVTVGGSFVYYAPSEHDMFIISGLNSTLGELSVVSGDNIMYSIT